MEYNIEDYLRAIRIKNIIISFYQLYKKFKHLTRWFFKEIDLYNYHMREN